MSVLSLNQPIPYFDTVTAPAGRDHPVFVIACEDGSQLVIKKDDAGAGGRAAMKHNLGAMRAVNPAARGKALSPQEMTVLHDFVDQSEAWAGVIRWCPEHADTGYLRHYLKSPSPGMWFKMNKVNGIAGLDAAVRGLQQEKKDKSGARAFAAALNAPGGFELLGRIAAADMYNGNQDRFVHDGEGSLNPFSADKSRFKRIFNLGNILIGLDGGKMKPVGLDTVDPNSLYNDVTQPLGNLETGADEKWSGRLLAPQSGADRKKFAEEIFEDLQVALGPRDRKLFFLSKKRLNANGPRRILAGMEQAIPLLRARLDRKLGRPNPLAGLASRRGVFG